MDKKRFRQQIYPHAIVGGLHILHPHGGPVEVRIFHTPRHGTLSGYYTEPLVLARDIQPWIEISSIYVTLNQLGPAVLGRAHNRLQEWARFTTADEDILRRQWFPLDFDPSRPRGVAATDTEAEAAALRRDETIDFLAARGFPEPLRVMSGNGAWALWRVDLPNTADSTKLVRTAMRAISARFTDNTVTVDPGVFHAAQLMKLCGTVAVTGDAMPDRPHRRVRFDPPLPLQLLSSEALQLVMAEQLQVIASQLGPAQAANRPQPTSEGINVLKLLTEKGLYLRPLGDA
jgi:hypothetical protein